MKLEKKHYVIIGIVLGTILVWYFYFRNKKSESSYRGIAPYKRKLDFVAASTPNCPRGCTYVKAAKTCFCPPEGPSNTSIL
jgi:hypothetical protein